MDAIAGSLSDQDMADLAAYYVRRQVSAPITPGTKTMNKIFLALACAVALAATSALAADVEAGRRKADEVCKACHGEGWRQADHAADADPRRPV